MALIFFYVFLFFFFVGGLGWALKDVQLKISDLFAGSDCERSRSTDHKEEQRIDIPEK